jgi:hypothetical protein
MPLSVSDYPVLNNEAYDRKVVMSETVFLYLVKRAYPNDLVQIRWPELPVEEMVVFWEPVVTVVRPDTPSA